MSASNPTMREARPTTTPGRGPPTRQVLCSGDLFIWASPNAGNPQKVQRYPIEWAIVLREMATLGAEVMLPGHGLPIIGHDRIVQALTDTAELLESLHDQTLALMNEGARLDEILHTVAHPGTCSTSPTCNPCTTSRSSSCATSGDCTAVGTTATRPT